MNPRTLAAWAVLAALAGVTVAGIAQTGLLQALAGADCALCAFVLARADYLRRRGRG